MRRCYLISDASGVLIVGAITLFLLLRFAVTVQCAHVHAFDVLYIAYKSDVSVYFDICSVFIVVKYLLVVWYFVCV